MNLGMTMELQMGMEQETTRSRAAVWLQDGQRIPPDHLRTMAYAIADALDAVEVALLAFGDKAAIDAIREAQERFINGLASPFR